MAAIPIGISQASKAHKAAPTEQTRSLHNPGEQSSENAAPAPEQNPAKRPANFGAALVGLALIGLASPFLELANPFQGLIGLVILYVGMQFAWKMTRGISPQILGPFKLSPSPAGQPGAG
jgi:predicted lipid-binding transport protein (Tim44 family)